MYKYTSMHVCVRARDVQEMCKTRWWWEAVGGRSRHAAGSRLLSVALGSAANVSASVRLFIFLTPVLRCNRAVHYVSRLIVGRAVFEILFSHVAFLARNCRDREICLHACSLSVCSMFSSALSQSQSLRNAHCLALILFINVPWCEVRFRRTHCVLCAVLRVEDYIRHKEPFDLHRAAYINAI